MSKDEVTALADCFKILLDDVRKNFVVSEPWRDASGVVRVSLTRRDDDQVQGDQTQHNDVRADQA